MTCIIYKHIFYYVCQLIKLCFFLGNWLIMNKRATITYITSSLHVVPYRKSLSQSTSTVLRFVIVCDKVGKLIIRISFFVFWGGVFSVRLLSVLRGHSVFSSPPQRPMTSDFEGFSIPDFIHYIYFPILIPEKEPVFPFFNVQC